MRIRIILQLFCQSKMNKTHNHILLSIKSSKKIINAQNTKYPIVKEVALALGFQFDSDFFTLYWTDAALSTKQIRQLPLYVKVNHFPDIITLTRKNKLASALNSMLRYFPKQYDFYPQTYLLPMDYSLLQKRQHKDRFYIVKPENGCQGKGIYLTNSIAKIQKASPMIVQRYLNNPLLIDRLKFDLRIYVLITCIQPLRIFMFKDGLARFATEPFQHPNEHNANDLFKHLTNYAINKNHQQFIVDDDDYSKGHKRLLSTLFSPQALKVLLKNIGQIVIKSVISVLPTLQNSLTLCKRQNINSCFQLLGFDILMTDNGKIKLLQINQNPSLMTQTNVDISLKKQLLTTIFQMVQSSYQFNDNINESKIRAKDRRQLERAGQFTRIYPCETIQETQSYDHFMAKSQQLFRDKFGLGILREPKRQSVNKDNSEHLKWNQSTEFYSKQKLAKVYGARNMKTSQKRRFLFH